MRAFLNRKAQVTTAVTLASLVRSKNWQKAARNSVASHDCILDPRSEDGSSMVSFNPFRDCKRTPLRSFVLLALLAVGTFSNSCSSNQRELTGDDQVGIYAAMVRQIYYVDHGFQQPPAWSRIYVPRTTDDLQIDPDAPYSQPELLPTELQNNLASAISDLPTELFWVDDPDIEVLTDAETGLLMDGEGITLTLGNIHVQEDGSVLVSYWLYCGNVCGIGKTFVVEEVDGSWQVTGSTGVEIMS